MYCKTDNDFRRNLPHRSFYCLCYFIQIPENIFFKISLLLKIYHAIAHNYLAIAKRSGRDVAGKESFKTNIKNLIGLSFPHVTPHKAI